MGYKVLIPQDIPNEGKNFLLEKGYEIKVGSGITEEAKKKDIEDCDAIILRTAVLTDEIVMAAPKLKVISRYGVGVDNIPVAKAEELGIWVATVQTANANTVAEAAVTFIAALGKRFKEIGIDFCVKGNYNIRNQLMGNDLEGKVVSILGFGRIGKLVAQKCALGFGMKILAYDPYVKKDQVPDYVELVDRWEEMFSRGDFVSIHMPFNGEELVTRREFQLMKPSAYFINVARGALVDEAALIDALNNKQIAGAGLDVFEPEPPKKDNPLLHMDNVIAQPHSAALTKECTVRMSLHAAQNVDDVLSGKAPSWPYNKPLAPRYLK